MMIFLATLLGIAVLVVGFVLLHFIGKLLIFMFPEFFYWGLEVPFLIGIIATMSFSLIVCVCYMIGSGIISSFKG